MINFLNFYVSQKNDLYKYGKDLMEGSHCYRMGDSLIGAPIKEYWQKDIVYLLQQYLIEKRYGKNIEVLKTEEEGYYLTIDFTIADACNMAKHIVFKTCFNIQITKDKTLIKFMSAETQKKVEFQKYQDIIISLIANAWCYCVEKHHHMISSVHF